ncbi:hypothetical protein DL771_006011 [Monosporascus sp. 5C6A]|nr:hypothetical protein DL771_006011 [Monosporascus sp. 5C6A]
MLDKVLRYTAYVLAAVIIALAIAYYGLSADFQVNYTNHIGSVTNSRDAVDRIYTINQLMGTTVIILWVASLVITGLSIYTFIQRKMSPLKSASTLYLVASLRNLLSSTWNFAYAIEWLLEWAWLGEQAYYVLILSIILGWCSHGILLVVGYFVAVKSGPRGGVWSHTTKNDYGNRASGLTLRLTLGNCGLVGLGLNKKVRTNPVLSMLLAVIGAKPEIKCEGSESPSCANGDAVINFVKQTDHGDESKHLYPTTPGLTLTNHLVPWMADAASAAENRTLSTWNSATRQQRNHARVLAKATGGSPVPRPDPQAQKNRKKSGSSTFSLADTNDDLRGGTGDQRSANHFEYKYDASLDSLEEAKLPDRSIHLNPTAGRPGTCAPPGLSTSKHCRCSTQEPPTGSETSIQVGRHAMLRLWIPNSIVCFAVFAESFLATKLSKYAECQLVKGARLWKNTGLTFKLVPRDEAAMFLLVYCKFPADKDETTMGNVEHMAGVYTHEISLLRVQDMDIDSTRDLYGLMPKTSSRGMKIGWLKPPMFKRSTESSSVAGG